MIGKVFKFLIGFVFVVFILACSERNKTLPFLGQTNTNANGDTVKHTIADFKFVNQDGDSISQEFFKDKFYIADFFFTSCPTICPIMKTQMLRVFEKFRDQPNFLILSHTIDPGHDSVAVLKKYKEKLGINSSQWQFVTGDQEKIYEIALKSYLVSALEDKEAVDDGGFVHSGAFVLVDENKHIRGIYDGTKEKEVDKLIKDIEFLLKK